MTLSGSSHQGLHHAAHTTHAAHATSRHASRTSAFVLLGHIADHALGGQQQPGYGSGILQGRTRNLGRIDNTGFNQITDVCRLVVLIRAIAKKVLKVYLRIYER